MDSLIPILIITALILLNGLFVAAEFAIVGAPRALIDRLAMSGHRIARMVRRTLHTPRDQDRYIAAAQLGITFASLGLGMYGEHILAEWFAERLGALGIARWVAAHTVASVLAIAVLTYFHIVIGEMVPKALALQYADRTALLVTPAMRWVQIVLYPLVMMLNAIGNGILRLMGIQRDFSASHYHTPEELQYLVEESETGGLLRKESGRMIRDLFAFGELTAGEVMVPRVHIHGLAADASFEEMRRVIRASRHTRYPVYRNDLDHIIGMVHIKDLLRQLLSGQTLRQHELRSVPYVPETSTLDTVLAVMRRARTQMVVVLDEHGGTAGIVTIEDLFEEVVGDIEEGVTKPPDLYVDATGRLHAVGTVRITEIAEAIGVTLEHEDVDTVSGLVLTLLERPPVVGDAVTYDQVRFDVTAVDGLGVAECIVTHTPAERRGEAPLADGT